MHAVIFRATVKQLDAEYGETAERLRQRALQQFDCIEFISFTEADQEVAISWWPDEDAISRWREDAEHQRAQQLGKSRWYKDWSVQVVEVTRSYSGS